LEKLPYLQACMKEGLRMFPPITALRERVVPVGGDTVQGHFLPAGTCIGLNLPGLLTHPVFGSDSKVFRPERWLNAPSEQLRAMERTQELMFNWGFTRCMGIRLANMMIGKFMVEVSTISSWLEYTLTYISGASALGLDNNTPHDAMEK
jgi:cytochrome P450